MRFCGMRLAALLLVIAANLPGLPPEGVATLIPRNIEASPAYLLGPGDELALHVAELSEMSSRSFRIDPVGILHLPVLGSVKASGLSVEKLEASLRDGLRATLLDPKVSVSVVSFQSQPVSVLGAVNQPGIRQLQGPTRLLEAISWAGGPRQEAGDRIRITRRTEWGAIPLPTAKTDSSGAIATADLSFDDLTSGRGADKDIYLRPYDVISLDRADLIYVLGDVNKSGGFTLGPNEKMSVLQAVALAGGLQRTASPKNARILRKPLEGTERVDLRVDLRKIMEAEIPDVPLRADDVLFIPNNFPRSVALRSAEVAIQIGTGLAIWRR